MGAFGVGIVGEGGEAVAGGFGETDVAGDDGIEEQVAEVLFELFADFDDEQAVAYIKPRACLRARTLPMNYKEFKIYA